MAKVIYVGDDGKQKVLRDGNIEEWEVMFYKDYFAVKVWSEDDIEERMRETGYTVTPERVKVVLEAGKPWWGLSDCSDDWYAIDDVITSALGDPDTEPC